MIAVSVPGRAVSESAGEPYKDKLLKLPTFLQPGGGDAAPEELMKGLTLTGYFLIHWVFAHHSKGIPEERLRFEERFAKYTGVEYVAPAQAGAG